VVGRVVSSDVVHARHWTQHAHPKYSIDCCSIEHISGTLPVCGAAFFVRCCVATPVITDGSVSRAYICCATNTVLEKESHNVSIAVACGSCGGPCNGDTRSRAFVAPHFSCATAWQRPL
jgi:hypothetical protein